MWFSDRAYNDGKSISVWLGSLLINFNYNTVDEKVRKLVDGIETHHIKWGISSRKAYPNKGSQKIERKPPRRETCSNTRSSLGCCSFNEGHFDPGHYWFIVNNVKLHLGMNSKRAGVDPDQRPLQKQDWVRDKGQSRPEVASSTEAKLNWLTSLEL